MFRHFDELIIRNAGVAIVILAIMRCLASFNNTLRVVAAIAALITQSQLPVLASEHITIRDSVEAIDRRNMLRTFIWGTPELPPELLPQRIDTGIVDSLYIGMENLRQIDRYVIEMPHGIESVVYHFHPLQSINKLFVYHAGHWRGGFKEEELLMSGEVPPGFTIPRLIKAGYSVVAYSMPLYGNNNPVVTLEDGSEVTLVGHDQFWLLGFDSPYRFFFDPLVAVLNFAEQHYRYDDVLMAGLSGGGWTSTVYPALDPRIRLSFAVAGSVPLYLRPGYEGLGDGEQGYGYDGLYAIANYSELYVLAGFGFRRAHVQILNRFDNSTFWGDRHVFWVDSVKATMSMLGSGQYDFYLDETHRTHRLSAYAVSILMGMEETEAPLPPTLLRPSRDSLVGGPSVRLEWQRAVRAESYELNVALDSGFTEIIPIGPITHEQPIASVLSNLRRGRQHFWRVRAKNKFGEGAWSETRVVGVTANTPPEFALDSLVLAQAYRHFKYSIIARDADSLLWGDSLRYAIVSGPAWLVIDSLSGVLSGFPDADDLGPTELSIVAIDSFGDSTRHSCFLEVVRINEPPAITHVQAAPIFEDSLFTGRVFATDPDSLFWSDELKFTVVKGPPWLQIDSTFGYIWGRPTLFDVGNDSATVKVCDGNGGECTTSFVLSVLHMNHSPMFSLISAEHTIEDQTFSVTIRASDPDSLLFGDRPRYRLAFPSSWLSVDSSTGVLSGIPRIWNLPDTLVTVIAVDDSGATDTLSFSIPIVHVNHSPTFSSIPPTRAAEDSLYIYEVASSDIDTLVGDKVRYRLLTAPDWISMDSLSGRISGVPGAIDVGTAEITLAAKDDSGATAVQSFSLTTIHTNHNPVVVALPQSYAVEDTPYASQIVVTDADNDVFGDRLEFHAILMPEWLSLDPSTGALSGTPRLGQLQSSTIEVAVTDGNGGVSTASATVRVTHTNHPPTFAQLSDKNSDAVEDIHYTLPLRAFDPDAGIYGDSLTFHVLVTPHWLAFDADSRNLSGTPREGDGDTVVVVRVTDGRLFDTLLVRLAVQQINDPPRLAALPRVEIHEDSSFVLAIGQFVSDPDGGLEAMSWQISSEEACMHLLELPEEVSDDFVEDISPIEHPGQLLVLFDSVSARIAFVSQNNFNGLDIPVVLTVRDIEGLSSKDTIFVSVMPANDPPRVSSFRSIALPEDATHSIPFSKLYAKVTDPDDPDSLITWRSGIRGSIESRWTEAGLLLEPPENWTGSDTLYLYALDREGLADTVEVPIQVTPVNDPPRFVTVPDSTAIARTSYRCTVQVEDVDHDQHELQFSLLGPGWLQIDSLGTIFGIPPGPTIEEARVIIADPAGGADTLHFKISVGDAPVEIPSEFVVTNNYPNPFNPSTTFRFGVPEPSMVFVEVYNTIGQRVAEVVRADLQAGYHEIHWAPAQLASGTYLVVFQSHGLANSNREARIVKKVSYVK